MGANVRASSAGGKDGVANRLFRLMIGVFFGGGMLNAMVALLVPRLKITLGLDYAEALSVQFAYYSSYLLFAVPATMLTVRAGFMRAISVALAIVAAGCVAFALAQAWRDFPAVLLSLLLISSGVTILQIAGNAAVTSAGPSPRVASRFTLLQAFNSLGTVMGPLIGAWFLLGGVGGQWWPALPFLGGAAGLGALSLAFLGARDLLPPMARPVAPALARLPVIARDRRMLGGIAAIFAYVGAEVTIGTLAVAYLMLPGQLDASALTAGRLVSLYWAGAMVGRFVGAALLRRIAAARLLVCAAAGAGSLLVGAMALGGIAGSALILSIGLFNSIMFPTIYALAMPDRGEDQPIAAMPLCMAVVGGAIIPLATGALADATALVPSLALPGLCYGVIMVFALARLTPVPEPA